MFGDGGDYFADSSAASEKDGVTVGKQGRCECMWGRICAGWRTRGDAAGRRGQRSGRKLGFIRDPRSVWWVSPGLRVEMSEAEIVDILDYGWVHGGRECPTLRSTLKGGC